LAQAILAQVLISRPLAGVEGALLAVLQLPGISMAAAMEVDGALETQRKAHPDMVEALDEIQKLGTDKLFHQLTQAILKYIGQPCFDKAGTAGELLAFYTGYIKSFVNKFNKIHTLRILVIVCKQQAPDVALELLRAPFEDPQFTVHAGIIPEGGDLLTEKMTLSEAKKKCRELPGCKGFCFTGTGVGSTVDVQFKSNWGVQKSKKEGEGDAKAYKLEATIEGDRDTTFLWQTLKSEKLIFAGKFDEAKDDLEILDKAIGEAYEVDALIQSNFHKTYSLLWKKLERPQEFFKSSILYLAFTPISAILEEDRPRLAFEISVAGMIAEEEFIFGELLQQELLLSMDGSPYAWVKDFLQAFGEGKFELYDAALAKHKAQLEATPELKGKEATVLRPKMAALSLIELVFRKPKKQRRVTFEELSTHCRVEPKEVEPLVMRAMCNQLIKGRIDEVAGLVTITWVKPRILDTAHVDMMRNRMDEWAKQTDFLVQHLEEMTPELLVS